MFPTKSICLIRAFAPSVIVNDTCWPAPPMVLASCFTVAKGYPFAASICLIRPSTFLAFAGS